ncbi:MAG: sugar phosphate isomerase/epimerase [Chloroflexi bacterium]|nr:MAG: sugar phosphate isomerase/epimerase [Chloroflexota bacterium]
MRLGAPVFVEQLDPQTWTAELARQGFRAATFPLDHTAASQDIHAFELAARQADILIAEVGVWNNPLSRDEAVRRPALAACQAQLALADEVGARCCVNIAGSLGPKWDGPCPDDLVPETFDLVVESVRQIIDAVRPTRTFYTLECMPWMFPDSTENYLHLLHAVDRPQFAVHFDPVNLVNSPQKYFQNAALTGEFVEKLGAHIRSVHIKDIILGDSLTVHLSEVRSGLGGLDTPALLRALNRLAPDLPILLEHLPNPAEYAAAAANIRAVARREGIGL